MRCKIKLGLDKLPVEAIVIETSRKLNSILGHDHEWHDLECKPYSCSLISGGTLDKRTVKFNGNSHFYINTDDDKVIDAITNNIGIEFEIESPKVFKGYNILSVKNVRYNTNGKTEWVTKKNEAEFIGYVKRKFGVDIEILKMNNSVVHYKRGSKISVSNLLIRCNSDKNVGNLFESGIGGSCSLGFGFVNTIK